MVTLAADSRKWWILAATSGVLGLTVLDETIVGVALPTMRSDLSMGALASHWVVNAYLLTFTCFVALGGRMGDAIDRGRLFIFGALLFGVSSLACGFAPNGAFLIGARAIQGAGAAIIFPAALSMITLAFKKEEHGVALGLQTNISALFMSLGPLVGGLLTETLSWRWIFWVNLPVVIAVAAFVFLAWDQPPPERKPERQRDHWGFPTLIVGLSLIVVALMQGADWGWLSGLTLLLFAAGVVLLAIFFMVEKRLETAFFHVDLLKIATFTGGNIVFFSFQFMKMVIFVFTPLYLQQVMKVSAIESGAVLLLAILPTLLTSYGSGRVSDLYGSRAPLLITLVINGASVLFIALGVGLQSFWLIVAALIVWGASLPFFAVPARKALMNAVPEAERGQASGINLTIQMFGGTVGIALCGALLLETGQFWPVYLTTGALVFVTALFVWQLVEKQVADQKIN
ncbi:MFS transporter [Hoeflea sp. CAU 1731]